MSKRFRLKDLFYRYPWLGKAQHAIVGTAAYCGIKLFEHSFRKIRILSPGARKLIQERRPVIYALYHGDMDLMLELPYPEDTTVLISPSRDGDLVEDITRKLGYTVVRGSSAKRGVSGLLGLIEATKAGRSVALLVDGPKGPWHEIKPGVVKVAQISGLPIIPLGMSSRSCWWVPTWDRFNMVSLFGPVITVYGDPIYVSPDASEEELDAMLVELDRAMCRINEWTDKPWVASDGKRVIGFVG